jgi:hypothetical protein
MKTGWKRSPDRNPTAQEGERKKSGGGPSEADEVQSTKDGERVRYILRHVFWRDNPEDWRRWAAE